MDNTHVRLVKNLTTSYEIFKPISQKYEGAAFHGDSNYFMEIKYAEDFNLTDLFLTLKNAMKAAQEVTDSVVTARQKSIYLFISISKSWKDDLRIWKGQRNYIPYEYLMQSIESKVRDIQAHERCMLTNDTSETTTTKGEQALVATGPQHVYTHVNNDFNVCSYCAHPRHNIRQCRDQQRDLGDGRVKDGTVLPAKFAFKINLKRDLPYRSSKGGRNNGSVVL